MPPADPAAASAAVANCRELLTCNIVDFENMSAACSADLFVLAREFVRLLDAGELVQMDRLAKLLDDYRDTGPIDEGDGRAEDYRLGWNECLDGLKRAIPRLAAALGPLIVKEERT